MLECHDFDSICYSCMHPKHETHRNEQKTIFFPFTAKIIEKESENSNCVTHYSSIGLSTAWNLLLFSENCLRLIQMCEKHFFDTTSYGWNSVVVVCILFCSCANENAIVMCNWYKINTLSKLNK